jgi:pre-mRNA-splicing helicase BRR2
MSGNPEAASILAALRATRTSARERQSAMERNIRWVLGVHAEYS